MTMKMKDDLTAEFVASILELNVDTGELRWKSGPRKGKIAGCPAASGHLTVRIRGSLYYAHRIVWLLTTGEWPTSGLDHKNTESADNCFGNLRPSTQVQNIANSRLSKRNTSGFKGVSWCKSKKKWEAYIGIGKGRIKHLGRFDRAEDAHAAYQAAAIVRFGEFARFA